MKKYLKLELPSAGKNIPAEIDARILASAGIKARALRRKRFLTRMVLPGVATGSAAAAAAVMMLMPSAALPGQENLQPHSGVISHPAVMAVISKTPATPQNPASQKEMLALADTTILEQECYNLVNIAEFSLDSDNLSI